MNLSREAEARLFGLYRNGKAFASQRSHAIGYGGLTRPHEFPEPYHELISKGLVKLSEERALRPPGDYTSKARNQWVYKPTDLGMVTAKLMGGDEQK